MRNAVHLSATADSVGRRAGVSQRRQISSLLAQLTETSARLDESCAEALENYRQQRCNEHHLKFKTIASYEAGLRRMADAFGDIAVGDLTSTHVNDHLSTISRGSLSSHFSVLSASFRWLDRNGYPGIGALVPRKRPKSRPRDVALTDVQYRELLRWLDMGRERGWIYSRMYPILRFAALVPLRRNEIASLRRCECDLRSRVVSLYDTKTGDRFVPLSRVAASIIAAQPETESGYVFGAMRGEGAHVDDGSITRAFNRIKRRAIAAGANLPPRLRFHDLRHSWATKAVRDGWPMKLVQDVMGHSEAYMTARYVHLQADDLRGVVDDLEASLLGDADPDQLEATWS